ncbi:MAG: ATP-binding protein [Desulforhopalus sp.]|nr:ATP-binding protein [Desulforhopalus sp.]
MHFFHFKGIREEYDSETLRKVILLYVFLGVGCLFLIIMGIIAFVQRAVLLGLADFVTAALGITLLLYLNKTGDEPTCSKVGVLGLGLFFGVLFFIGGVHATAFMWLYTFPLISLYLLGLRQGISLALLLLVYCAGFLAFDLSSDLINVYSRDFAIRFIPSYLMVCLLAFLVEKSRYQTWKSLFDKQQLLAKTVQELQVKETELQESRNNLELRVAERTEDLEKANEQLRVEIEERELAQQERSRLEAELLRAQKMEAIGQLAGGVAHDFNNMLGVIVGYSEMILEQVDSSQPFHAELEEILNASRRSADLTRQLLTFARKQTVEPQVLDLNKTIEGMLNMLRRLIGENIDLMWIPGSDLWPINMDPSQIDQILTNLCVNARDAIGGVGKLTVATKNAIFNQDYCATHAGSLPGEYVTIAVSDTGSGMDEETLTHIFEPFFTTKDIGEGTGLGLATVYGAVKQNNGFINLASEPGQGTTFTICIPRHVETATEARPAPSAEAVVHGDEIVLLVEDEPTLLHMSTSMLERLGYTVLAAGTPSEGIRLANEYPGQIHLLATDVIMPEMNGRELSARLLESRPEMKCLFMSGYPADIIANQGVLIEGVSFLRKPFSKGELAAKVREALES